MASITAIQADLQALLPDVPILLGMENLAAEAAPPRAVLVPADESFEPARQDGINNPRSIATRTLALEAHLWGQDFDAAEDLLNQFVSAVRQSVGVNYVLRSGTWKGQANVSLGRVYVLTLAVKVPVIETATGTATVTTIPQTITVDH